MTKIKTCLFSLALIVLTLPIFACAAQMGLLRDQIKIETQDGRTFVFNVELAMSPAEQARGLMNRTMLEPKAGMLFIFGDKEEMRSFWMRNTLIPLDILFLAKDGTIHHIHPMARPLDESHITSKRPSSAVLEINGGLADKLGIHEGDRVIHPVFRNTLAP